MAGIFVEEHEAGPTSPRVVFVHGSLDRSTAFARCARLLADLSSARYDRRGYGRSLGLGPARSFAAQVDDLEAVIASRPSVLFGHSFGGVVALALAARQPELAPAVVAYEAPMSWEAWWPSSTAGAAAVSDGDDEGAAERFMRRMIGDERWDSLPERTKAQRRAEGPALVAELRSIRGPAPAPYDLRALSVPVVAACGSASSAHHQKTARVLAEGAPLGELRVVEDASHGVHLTHPAAVAALVRHALTRARSG